jgi:hypothetical protein
MKRANNMLDMHYGVIDHKKFESDGPKLIQLLTRPIMCYNLYLLFEQQKSHFSLTHGSKAFLKRNLILIRLKKFLNF